MKVSYATLLVIAALTLAVWVFFYIRTPDEPLNAKETTIVALVIALAVFFVKWLIGVLCGKEAKRDDTAKNH